MHCDHCYSYIMFFPIRVTILIKKERRIAKLCAYLCTLPSVLCFISAAALLHCATRLIWIKHRGANRKGKFKRQVSTGTGTAEGKLLFQH